MKKTDAGRPLFLTIACEELRVFGEFRRLTEKIRTLSDDMSGLVEIVSGAVLVLKQREMEDGRVEEIGK